MTLLNENHIESLIILILGSYLLVIIISELLISIFTDGSYFEVFNRKHRFFVCRLPSETVVPFNVQPHVQGEGDSIS